MYAKLALRNIRRSLRDYIIYFVTLTLTAALMYSFLTLGFSSDVLAMAENMSILTTGILLMSALVAFMSSFVIGYAIRFMLGRRKKEFATYELIGMEAKTNTVSKLHVVHRSFQRDKDYLRRKTYMERLGMLAFQGLFICVFLHWKITRPFR